MKYQLLNVNICIHRLPTTIFYKTKANTDVNNNQQLSLDGNFL